MRTTPREEISNKNSANPCARRTSGTTSPSDFRGTFARTPYPQKQFLRRRRLAILALFGALSVACRWQAANTTPSYPVGEGVYPKPVVSDRRPNAALFYMAAADAYRANMPVGMPHAVGDLESAPFAVQMEHVRKAQPAFVLLRQGMGYVFTPDPAHNFFAATDTIGEGPLQPRDFAPLRNMSYVLAAESRVKEASGDTYGALESSLDALRLGIDCGQGQSMTEGLFGVLLQCVGASEGVRHVAGLTGPESRAAIARLEPMLARERTIAQMVTAERDSCTYRTLGHLFETGTLRGLNAATGDEFDLHGAPWQFATGTVVFARTKQGIVNDFALQYDKILNRVKLPYHLASHQDAVTDSSNPLVRYWLMKDFERAFYHTVRQSTQNRVLLTQLAVQAYRREHGGAAPQTLGALVVGEKPYLRTTLSDPFAPVPGSPLRYDPQTGATYSVGENGVDDLNQKDDNTYLNR